MRYLHKSGERERRYAGLAYEAGNAAGNRKIREMLLEDQLGFCAYSERYVEPTDAAEVEHFDDRLKHTLQDGYRNWYAVLRWFNARKKRMAGFEPILSPYADDLQARIAFDGTLFHPLDAGDVEAQNLIDFIGANRPELVQQRQTHIRLLRDMFEEPGNRTEFLNFLRRHRAALSFLSAIAHAFALSADEVDYLLS